MNTRERFETTFPVASYEADFNGRMSLQALFNRFQDIAGLHAAYLQVGYEQLHARKLAWILSRIHVQILSSPVWGDSVRLATWPKGVDRLFAMREFSIMNERREVLVLATSAWLLVDTVKNRPQKIESLPIDLRFPGAPYAIQKTPDKIQLPGELQTVLERPLWLSDIDTNQHVNNAQYARWIGDCFSANQFRDHRITSMQINYLEESLLGDTIRLLKTPMEDREGEYFIAGVSLKNGATVFHARVTWN